MTCIATCFSFTNNAENTTVSQGISNAGPGPLQQVSEGPALATGSKFSLYFLDNPELSFFILFFPLF